MYMKSQNEQSEFPKCTFFQVKRFGHGDSDVVISYSAFYSNPIFTN